MPMSNEEKEKIAKRAARGKEIADLALLTDDEVLKAIKKQEERLRKLGEKIGNDSTQTPSILASAKKLISTVVTSYVSGNNAPNVNKPTKDNTRQ